MSSEFFRRAQIPLDSPKNNMTKQSKILPHCSRVPICWVDLQSLKRLRTIPALRTTGMRNRFYRRQYVKVIQQLFLAHVMKFLTEPAKWFGFTTQENRQKMPLPGMVSLLERELVSMSLYRGTLLSYPVAQISVREPSKKVLPPLGLRLDLTMPSYPHQKMRKKHHPKQTVFRKFEKARLLDSLVKHKRLKMRFRKAIANLNRWKPTAKQIPLNIKNQRQRLPTITRIFRIRLIV